MEYIAFGEVLFEEHSSSFSSPYLFNGKELDRETNLSYYGARYLDMKTSLWLNVDPLAEKMPSFGTYIYTFNNPIKYTDPTGMIAEPPVGLDAEDGAIHNDGSGSWKYNKATTTWVGQKNKDGKTSKNIGNTIELDNVNIKGYKKQSYFQGYYDTYKYIDGENPYSPYVPDGYAITAYGSVDYNGTSFSANTSLVLDGHTNELAGFSTTGVGVSTTMGFSWNFGISIDILDKYDKAGSKNKQKLFDRLLDYSKGGGASYSNWGVSHYTTTEPNEKGQFVTPLSGVTSNSLIYSINPGAGANYGITKTKRLF